MPTAELEDELNRYLAAREQQRAEATRATWDAMTSTEQKLFREAAVMGYIQAVRQHAPHGAPIPRDRTVVAAVIDAIHAFDDLYPFTSGLTRRRKAAALGGPGRGETDEVTNA